MSDGLRPLPDPATLDPLRRLSVADVLALPTFAGATCLAGGESLKRRVRHVNVMQVPTERFARSGDLVLASDDTFRNAPAGAPALLAALDDRRVVGIVLRGPGLQEIRDELVQAAVESRMPLIELPGDAHLSEILTGTLEALVATQAMQLRRAAEVRDELSGFVLSGGGLSLLPDIVAELTVGDVAVIDADGVVLAASQNADRERAAELAAAWLAGDHQSPALADGSWVVWPMLAGGVRLGCMVANLPGPLDAVRLAALENGGSSAALEILQRREAADADTRLRERFVSDLLARSLEPEAIGRRAAALGWEADDSYVVVLARGADPADLTAAAAGCVPRAVAVERRNTCMVIAPASGAPPLPSEQIAAVLSRVDRGVHVGMSSRLSSVSHLPTGLREADEALRVAEVFDRRGRVRCHGELGALRLLADAPPEELEAFAAEALAPLDSLEPGTREPLSATLSELIATGLNLAETARRGGWHYNTVRYRLRRLSEILGPFMEDGARLQTLTLALLLRRELGDRPSPDRDGSSGAVQCLATLGLGDDETIAQDPAAVGLEA